uniref:UDP-N-acetylglucosamine transferase subunit ALG13 n=1 Tax=Myxobolus squamalis TaxID=59785 RepID=A0A6B2GAP3_MYXSQ
MANLVFVTVGTTSFPELVTAVSSKSFCLALKKTGIKKINIQYGNGQPPDSLYFDANNIEMSCFDFKNSLNKQFEECDVVISHAGAGSVLEGLKHDKKLLVVINEALMNNHQTELAHKLESEEYLLSCLVKNVEESFIKVIKTDFREYNKVMNTKLGVYIESFMCHDS